MAAMKKGNVSSPSNSTVDGDFIDEVDNVPSTAFDETVEGPRVIELLKMLSTKGTPKASVAESIASLVSGVDDNSSGVFYPLKAWGLAAKLQAMLDDSSKSAAEGREGAIVTLTTLSSSKTHSSKAYEALMLSLLPKVLDCLADKVKPVATAAEQALKTLTANISPLATRKILIPALLDGCEFKKAWQTKLAALSLLSEVAKNQMVETGDSLSTIVPRLTDAVNDIKAQVKEQAIQTMIACCMCVGNRDIEPFVPAIVSCVARPEEITDCIHRLGATTFVSEVRTPTLAIVVPILRRGLREGTTAIQRKSAVIIDNMSKLVEDPCDAEPFLPLLLPELAKCADSIADPEARSVCNKAMLGLKKIETALEAAKGKPKTYRSVADKDVLSAFKELLGKDVCPLDDPSSEPLQAYICAVVSALVIQENFQPEAWRQALSAFVASGLGVGKNRKKSLCDQFAERCEVLSTGIDKAAKARAEEEDTTGMEMLCDCTFTLAYGAKILLNMATLKLFRGKRYGLCGPNGAGKSTLMRAIANGQVDGFPSADQVKTVYVEHDIDSEDSDTSVLNYVANDASVRAVESDVSVIEAALTNVGFTKLMLGQPVGSLSGGWKMKLALARAMLMRADILLLDEPTNHLDVKNVAWITNWVKTQTNVTSIVVSHDSDFLDDVCTNIIHYEGRKLKTYKGNLAELVKHCPEARSYYELQASATAFVQAFKFPEPGFLDGVKTKDKAILKCHNVTYQYPNTPKPVIENVSIYVSLSSRVAVVGPNGAGKSTLIKVLCGEMEPTDGNVWKHQNLRVAYVAQHAFHHIEKQLDKTPNEYIQWRYAIGEDREALMKVDRAIDEEEAKKLANVVFAIDGQKLKVEKLIARRKAKKTYEYEVHWQGKQPIPDQTTWLPREKLEEMGYSKMLAEVDAKEAAAAGMWNKPLTSENIAKHLEDCGLEREFSLHSQMKGLSGGQKVKVVLGACTWNNPHIIVLDEPTNYLDRDSLAALCEAIKTFGGGVLLISHHQEFLDAICNETWRMDGGRLAKEGGVEPGHGEKLEEIKMDEMVDGAGNTIKIKSTKKLSRKEAKQKERYKKLARANGEAVSDDDEDDF